MELLHSAAARNPQKCLASVSVTKGRAWHATPWTGDTPGSPLVGMVDPNSIPTSEEPKSRPSESAALGVGRFGFWPRGSRQTFGHLAIETTSTLLCRRTLTREPIGMSDFEELLTDLVENFKASGRPLDEAIEAMERALSSLRRAATRDIPRRIGSLRSR